MKPSPPSGRLFPLPAAPRPWRAPSHPRPSRPSRPSRRTGAGLLLLVGLGLLGPAAPAPAVRAADQPPPTRRAAARFLVQASFGPNDAEIQRVQQLGFDGYLEDQFNRPPTTQLDVFTRINNVVPPITRNDAGLQESFWTVAVNGPDQLRQRVAFALSEIMVTSVVSATPVANRPSGVCSYLDLLRRDAFGNFRDLLQDVTLHPIMGLYLNMLGNDKENPATGQKPNENYGREVLQLFTIGLTQLNPDGTPVLDGQGQPVPTYDQDVVEGFSHVFTGWSFAGNTADPRAFGKSGDPTQPMQLWPSHHDLSAKTLLDGTVLPAGQSGDQDLAAALDNIFQHPNVGPFVGRLLIQRLVTSNPSPGYVRRVATVFADNGQGVRGDLRAVVRAILLDREARDARSAARRAKAGELREPIVRFAALLRAFQAAAPSGRVVVGNTDGSLGQTPSQSPTVFNFFHPDYAPPGPITAAGKVAPEFEITGPSTVVGTDNLFWNFVYAQPRADRPNQLSPQFDAELALAGDPARLVEHLNVLLTGGALTPPARRTLVDAVRAFPADPPDQRVRAAAYLVATSGDAAALR